MKLEQRESEIERVEENGKWDYVMDRERQRNKQ